jgi:hypothetical protein
MAVKSFALFVVLAVLMVTGTAAARPGGPNDGTLTVKNGDGRIVFVGKGAVAVIGRFDKGQVTIKDPNPNDAIHPIVTGADATQSLTEKSTRYSGSNVRFRIIGSSFSITVFATDINLSAIGRGMVTLNSALGGRSNVGTYAVNGGAPQALPNFPYTFPLDAQAGG